MVLVVRIYAVLVMISLVIIHAQKMVKKFAYLDGRVIIVKNHVVQKVVFTEHVISPTLANVVPAGKVPCVINVNPIPDVFMVHVIYPGNVVAMKAGVVCFATKISIIAPIIDPVITKEPVSIRGKVFTPANVRLDSMVLNVRYK